MKTLELNKMEGIVGGDLLDGVCSIAGVTSSGMGIRFLIGRAVALTPVGAGVMAGVAVACGGRVLGLY